MLWFCSDNGPENGTPGSSGPYRERKRSLYEGGLRVPAFCVWENTIETNQTSDFPVTTSDYLPTILDMLGISHHLARPMDGASVIGVFEGEEVKRTKPMGFLFGAKRSWVTHEYKLISTDDGESYELYNLLNDQEEVNDVAAANPEIVKKMKNNLLAWINSVNNSRTGGDY
jgi:arylsulfatase A-like enzyme